ncbi:MAG: hypothetical protein E5V58_18365 [Mesorhizobium sp.]|uniref:hypothetical protein n=1 Tax=Mesorhizobium sp. TaxID=1871066 RepID=UPI000FE9D052|nr:hypothetical protein [Mesorhizobium sp.]RWC94873.1 MAG: hypothetical protein EOS32_15135 [Mesorhizobium sp.]TIW71664.1 MAG: hypothetical protein E5V58_18365 [Mesorhizobium sp.]
MIAKNKLVDKAKNWAIHGLCIARPRASPCGRAVIAKKQAGRQGEELGSLRQSYPAGHLPRVSALPVRTDFNVRSGSRNPHQLTRQGELSSSFRSRNTEPAEQSAGFSLSG